MNWKEELVKKINALKPEDFRDGRARIDVAFNGRAENHEHLIRMILEITEKVNSHPVGWVGPGYLKMLGASITLTPECILECVLSFEVSRDLKHNEVIIQDFTGVIGKTEIPFYDEIDFMSL